MTSSKIPWSLLDVFSYTLLVLSIFSAFVPSVVLVGDGGCRAVGRVYGDGGVGGGSRGGGVVMKGEALAAPRYTPLVDAPLVDSIRGGSLAATKGDALAKEYEDELDEGRGVGARRGSFLSTSGSFTLSSGGASRAGVEEEEHEL